MEPYLEYTFKLYQEDFGDIVIAFLSQYPFEAFQEMDRDHLGAVMKESAWSEELEVSFLEEIAPYCTLLSRQPSEPINWNKEWEKNFHSIEIGDLCRIYTPFHEQRDGYKYQIKIQPKMAFGTGHHATTRMMIQMMDEINLEGKHVLDFGCGSGILGILAGKMKADSVLGIDIEPWAIENSVDNALLNEVTQAHFSGKHIAHLVDEKLKFDVILANIQLDVLVSNLEPIKNLLFDRSGLVIISGVLEDFRHDLEQVYHDGGLRLLKTLSEDKWICQLYSF